MIPGLSIRRVTAADLQAVCEIEARVYPDPWAQDDFRALQSPNPDIMFLVAQENKAIIGYLIAQWEDTVVHIHNIAVDLHRQHRGVGKLLMHALLQEIPHNEAVNIYLEVAPSNWPAIQFYRHLGFQDYEVRTRYYRNGEDALIMAKGPLTNGLV